MSGKNVSKYEFIHVFFYIYACTPKCYWFWLSRPPYQVVYGCRVADQEELRSLREERTAKAREGALESDVT